MGASLGWVRTASCLRCMHRSTERQGLAKLGTAVHLHKWESLFALLLVTCLPAYACQG